MLLLRAPVEHHSARTDACTCLRKREREQRANVPLLERTITNCARRTRARVLAGESAHRQDEELEKNASALGRTKSPTHGGRHRDVGKAGYKNRYICARGVGGARLHASPPVADYVQRELVPLSRVTGLPYKLLTGIRQCLLAQFAPLPTTAAEIWRDLGETAALLPTGRIFPRSSLSPSLPLSLPPSLPPSLSPPLPLVLGCSK